MAACDNQTVFLTVGDRKYRLEGVVVTVNSDEAIFRRWDCLADKPAYNDTPEQFIGYKHTGKHRLELTAEEFELVD